jgi:hypothetical protein
MSRRSEEVSAYIEAAAPFARSIMKRIRTAAHAADPSITEAMKWSCPAFMGRGILANVGAFKAHVRFGFWRGKDMKDLNEHFEKSKTESVCAWKVEHVRDLPPKETLVAWFQEALALDATLSQPSKKKSSARRAPDRKVAVPEDFAAALAGNAAANATFEAFPYSKRKDYVEWITGAKREATRARRLAQAIEWLAEGKSRNWKYESC